MVIARLYYLISWLVCLLYIQSFRSSTKYSLARSQNGMSDLSDMSMYILSLCRADTIKAYLGGLDWYHVVISYVYVIHETDEQRSHR
jgi:hypothetical protein